MKIALLISGGVDSSVALRLLREAGHDVTAFYLKIWLEDEMAFLGECPWEEDLSYSENVCKEANVSLEIVPFQKEYWERIVRYTIDEVRAGRTPNPDVLCNTRVKFGAFCEYLSSRSDGASFDKIASGHYAQVESLDGLCFLKKSPDVVKDQTYFLSQLSQRQVNRALFPIGHLQKSEVRALAEKFNLPNALRRDSQGLCFLGKIRFDEFVKFHLGTRTGDIVDYETREKLGEHDGFWYYTVGQRRGIQLSGGPWYVVSKDIANNTVFVSNAYRSVHSARNTFEVSGVNMLESPSIRQRDEWFSSRNIRVKLRHGALSYLCALEAIDGDRFRVTIDGYDTGIAAGQFAVFYDGEYCLGGGVIEV
jgi:tRNA-specific 2-thiouridylase